jgi:hypothetical protein
MRKLKVGTVGVVVRKVELLSAEKNYLPEGSEMNRRSYSSVDWTDVSPLVWKSRRWEGRRGSRPSSRSLTFISVSVGIAEAGCWKRSSKVIASKNLVIGQDIFRLQGRRLEP